MDVTATVDGPGDAGLAAWGRVAELPRIRAAQQESKQYTASGTARIARHYRKKNTTVMAMFTIVMPMRIWVGCSRRPSRAPQ